MKWVEIKSDNDLPSEGVQVFFDGGENPPIWGKVKRNGKHLYVVAVDSSGEEDYENTSDYCRWLDESGDGWISVEAPPTESGLVLISVNPTADIYIAYYKKGRHVFEVWGAGRDPITDMKTTHWKLLPEKPKQ